MLKSCTIFRSRCFRAGTFSNQRTKEQERTGEEESEQEERTTGENNKREQQEREQERTGEEEREKENKSLLGSHKGMDMGCVSAEEEKLVELDLLSKVLIRGLALQDVHRELLFADKRQWPFATAQQRQPQVHGTPHATQFRVRTLHSLPEFTLRFIDARPGSLR